MQIFGTLFVLLVLQVSVCIFAQNAKKWSLKGSKQRIREFMNFVERHGKEYQNNTEAQRRFSIYSQNLLGIQKASEAMKTAKLVVNKFTDMTDDELRSMLMRPDFRPNTVNLFSSSSSNHSTVPPSTDEPVPKVPSSKNWADEGHVSDIKDQGGCGSCYAFAAVGALEAAYSIAGYPGKSFSEQQLVDCDTANSGCGGGWMTTSYRYIQNNHLEMSSFYPYKGKKQSCQYNGNAATVRINGFQPLKTEGEILDWIGTRGPVAIALYINREFVSYSSGVLRASASQCGVLKNVGGHALTAVGYGTENGINYWLLKNSWGTAWGDKGFVKIERGVDYCGIESYGRFGNSAPVLTKPLSARFVNASPINSLLLLIIINVLACF